MYAFLDADRTFVRRLSDGATFAWDDNAAKPDTGAAAIARWEADGSPMPADYAPPAPTLDDYRCAIQSLIDETAAQRGYDSGVTCSSYLGSSNPAWAAEAATFVAWRDALWSYAYAELAKVESGQRPQPSVVDFVDELPAINWPT